MASLVRSKATESVDSDGDGSRQNPRTHAATGASAAGTRALSAQLIAFYFRAPVKAFFRTRVDYMAFPRAINPRIQDKKWSLHTTTPGLIAHAVRIHGWKFLPNQLLPPLLANTTVGAILYTSYLQVLGALHAPAKEGRGRIYPPAPPACTFTAGFTAGAIQSLVAAPLDALQVRLQTSGALKGQYQNMWEYGWKKLREIGVRGIFAGFSLSFMRDSLGLQRRDPSKMTTLQEYDKATIKPHFALEPCFLLGAGVAASLAQQTIQYPLGIIQNLHYGRLEYLDHQATLRHSRPQMLRHYYHAYQETFKRCQKRASRTGGWMRWLYSGFLRNSVRQVPSTSAGLVIFELMRRKYATAADTVLIEKDGFNILLTN